MISTKAQKRCGLGEVSQRGSGRSGWGSPRRAGPRATGSLPRAFSRARPSYAESWGTSQCDQAESPLPKETPSARPLSPYVTAAPLLPEPPVRLATSTARTVAITVFTACVVRGPHHSVARFFIPGASLFSGAVLNVLF